MAQNITLTNSIDTVKMNASNVEHFIYNGKHVWPIYSGDDLYWFLWDKRPTVEFREEHSCVDGASDSLYNCTDHSVHTETVQDAFSSKEVEIRCQLSTDNRTLTVWINCIKGGTVQEPQPMVYDIVQQAVNGGSLFVRYTID